MASGPHTFLTCVVFSPVKYEGNKLAIVCVRGNALSDARKSLIAKEFGYSETIFLHDAPGPDQPRRADIFTESGAEVPFAGHPIIGAAHYLFMFCERAPWPTPETQNRRQSAVLQTKAGLIPIFFNSFRQVAACSVPHNYHLHSKRVSFNDVLAVQPQLKIVPTTSKVQDKHFPVVSIVKGMTFALVDLTDSPEALTALRVGDTPNVDIDEAWAPSFVGAMYYERRGKQESDKEGEPTIHNLHVRMISHGIEDAGTGSGNCALACYLALTDSTSKASATPTRQKASIQDPDDLAAATADVDINAEEAEKRSQQQYVFAVEQGLEMGRKCTIAVEVSVEEDEKGERRVSGVMLSGRCTFFTRGEIFGIH